MNLIQDIIARAKENPQHIVLPEGTEERTLRAADMLLRDKVAKLTLIGNPDEIKALAKELNLDHIAKATLLNPANHEKNSSMPNC